MAGSRQTNTFGEALQKLLRDLADMKVMPDADLPFIVDIETKVIGKLRSGIDQSVQSGNSSVPVGIGGGPEMAMPPMPGGTPGGMPGGGGMPMPGGPPGVPGVSTSPQMPSTDELRRLLTQGQ